MRKFLLIIITTIILLSLSSCSTAKNATKPNSNAKNINVININANLISETKITDREKMFLSVGNNEYFIFDFNVDSKYKWVDVWVDRYELGRKTKSISKLSTGLSSGKESMIIATVSEFDKMNQTWTLVVNNGGATSTSKLTQEFKASENSSFSKMWGTNTSKTIPVSSKEITLANICYQDQRKSNSMSSLTDKFFNSPDQNTKEIEKYDFVYLLKCKFYENKPKE